MAQWPFRVMPLRAALGTMPGIQIVHHHGPGAIELRQLPIVPLGSGPASRATEADVVLSAQAAAPHSLPTASTAQGTAGTVSASHGLTVTVRGLPGAVDTRVGGEANFGSTTTGVDSRWRATTPTARSMRASAAAARRPPR